MVYNEKIKISMLKYQAKLRTQGKYNSNRHSKESRARQLEKQYINNSILYIKRLFGVIHLI